MRRLLAAILGVGLSLPLSLAAAPQILKPGLQVRNVMNTAANGSFTTRITKDPRDKTLYYLKLNGDLYRVNLAAGTSVLISSIANYFGMAPIGLDIGQDGTFYLFGSSTANNLTRATVVKGAINPANGQRVWSVVAQTEPFPGGGHGPNALLVAPDGLYLYINIGSRTDHGEVSTSSGAFPNAREVPLTATTLRVPAAGQNLLLANNTASLVTGGYLFAQGLRNTFDLRWAPNGDLFGAENGPDRDMSDELNWLRAGAHYGFPWRMGGDDNPQQFPNYDPAHDRLLNPNYWSVQNGLYHNDPIFPAPPAPLVFAEPVINLGPDADKFRDPFDGQVKDASDLSQSLSTFTAHRSPLGLVFDEDQVMTTEYRSHGFVLSYTTGDPNGASVAGPFKDASEDLCDLNLTKVGNNYEARVTRLVAGFSGPVDAEIIGNKIYVVEFGGNQGLWEITMPADHDRDGLPDDFEIQFGLNPNDASDAVLDADGDGLTNLQEFMAGTDPNNPASALQIKDTSVGPTGIVITFNSVTGKNYLVERCDNYPPGAWTSVGTSTGNGGIAQVIDPGGNNQQRRFYRLSVLP